MSTVHIVRCCSLMALLPSFAAPATAGGSVQSEDAKLLPVGGTERETCGSAVAIDGDTAILGADGTGWPITVSGAVYVLSRDAQGDWTQRQKLSASASPANDFFGGAVDVSGETILVGAPFEPDGFATGAAYVFTPDTDGVWHQQARLEAPDAAENARFGGGVAVDGDTAAVYGVADAADGERLGAVYVFARDATGAWSHRQTLFADDGVSMGSGNTTALTISGDTLAIGVPFDSEHGGNAGAAYVFRRDAAGIWQQDARLTASDAAEDNLFGSGMALHGDAMVIGAPDFNYPIAGLTGGKAYIFTRNDDGAWEEHRLTPPADNEVGDQFGRTVAFDGSTALIGQAPNGSNGSAYVYQQDADGSWAEQVKLVNSEPDAAGVGMAVAVGGNAVVLGAQFDHEVALYAGAAYSYTIAVPCPSDLDGDGQVGLSDLSILLGNFGGSGSPTDGDLDGDGQVGLSDLSILLSQFGSACA